MGKKVLAIVIVFMLTLGEVSNISAGTANPFSGGSGGVSSNSINMEADSSNKTDDKNVKVSKEEAKKISLELLKKYFGPEIDEKKYQVTTQLIPNYETNEDYSWHFSWHLSSSTMSTNISIEINACTGKLIGFNRSESYRNREQVEVASITNEQARKLADDFVKKINPEEFKQVKSEDLKVYRISSSGLRPNYSFNYIREINGLRYQDNTIRVGVNGTNGSIVSYRFRWDYDVKLPAVEGLLEKEKALGIFKERTNMDLSYISIRSPLTRYMVPVEVKLAYLPSSLSGMSIDAKTGESIDYNGMKTDSLKTRDITQEQKNKLMLNKPVTGVETSEMSSEKAEAFINGLVKEFFGVGYKAGNVNYSENEMGRNGVNRKAWTGEVLEDKPEAMDYKGTISIDGSTGEILSINRYVNEDWYGKEFERKLTWEQAYDKAVEMLGRYYQNKLGEVKTEQALSKNLHFINGKMIPDRMINFNFPRLVSGIQYGEDSINISIDAKTGEVNDLYYNWDTGVSFPEAEGIMDKAKAKEMFFKENDIKLVYFRCMKKTEGDKYSPDYKIVYVLEPKQIGNTSRNIDAFTGKLLNNYGNELDTTQNSFAEIIKGHPAEKELSILAFQGIIDANSFKPDSDTTYMELIRMLVNAKGYRPYGNMNLEELLFKNIDKKGENYSYLLEAVRYGIIENKPIDLKLDAKVTREQMAELMVKLLGYEKLAKAKDIFVLNFKDSDTISGELKGHVAIVKGLGIIDGSGEMFRPKENLKMHEAALIIYKTLDSMRKIK